MPTKWCMPRIIPRTSFCFIIIRRWFNFIEQGGLALDLDWLCVNEEEIQCHYSFCEKWNMAFSSSQPPLPQPASSTPPFARPCYSTPVHFALVYAWTRDFNQLTIWFALIPLLLGRSVKSPVFCIRFTWRGDQQTKANAPRWTLWLLIRLWRA